MNEEQKIIRKFFLPIAKNKESLDLRNDAAHIQGKENMVVSSDMMVEGRHFERSDDPINLAKKLLRVNLSDIAAMGAIPYGYILNLSLPKKNHDSWLKKFSYGLKVDSKKYNIKLFGGDLSSSKNIFLSLTIFGIVSKKFHKNTIAYEDSEIFVSGNIGDAGIGLKIKKEKNKNINKSLQKFFLKKFYLPKPQLQIGKSLIGISDFCKDISDGLIKEIKYISEISKLQSHIFLSQIPLSNQLKKVLIKSKHKKKMWEYILTTGEDYQLLFSIAKKNKKFLKKKNLKNITKIGFFKKGDGVKIYDNNNKILNFSRDGFSHF